MTTSESTRIHSSVAKQPNRERRVVMVSPSEYMDAIHEGLRLTKSGISQIAFLHGQEDMAQRWLDCPEEVALLAIIDPTFKLESDPTATGQ